MRTRARRLNNSGTALRNAMNDAGLTLQALAARTAEADPDGNGVSFQLIAFLATDLPWGRDTTSLRSASLIAGALGVPEETLFTREQLDLRRKSAEGGSSGKAA